jgi:hypothetical protein
MRTLVAAVPLLCGAASFALASACVDLFHSTNFETLCDVDARAPGCPPAEASSPTDASDAAPTNFCRWGSSEAHSHAEHACAWLSACSSPFDQNAFGPCMIDAVLAYDCSVNPNRTIVLGPLHDYWDALWQAKSCADVDAVLPHPSIQCGKSAGYACLGSSPNLLFQCADGMVQAESCLVEGWTCQGLACATPHESQACDPPDCTGTVLHACEDGGHDEGYDCRYFGKGTCKAVDKRSAGCAPNTEDGGGVACTPSTVITCDGGVASTCPTGTRETVACEGLTGKDTCNSQKTPSWNLAGACKSNAACDVGCGGRASDTLIGCGNGAEFTTSCEAQGLGACRSVPLAHSTGYACKSPP